MTETQPKLQTQPKKIEQTAPTWENFRVNELTEIILEILKVCQSQGENTRNISQKSNYQI